MDIVHRPQLGEQLGERLSERAQLLGTPSAIHWWTGQNSWVAETGRSLLSAVEEHVPQFNEMVATIMHYFAIHTYGQWVFTSPTGELPNFEPGIEAKIALTPEEKLERIQVGAISPDAYRLVQLISEEKQNGMLANILRASGATPNTGVLFQQMANAALNALEPYHDGMEEFGQHVGTSLLAQLRAARGTIAPFEVVAPGGRVSSSKTGFWVVEFDPKELDKTKKLRPRPVFKPALPDDLAVRINAARLALDPRRPILSLTTVLENILQIEDPTDEIDRIWEDMANSDPVLVLEQISMALERLGEGELATRIRENQFRAAFVQELQFRQATGNIPASPTGGLTGPPEMGGGQFNAQQTGGVGGEIAPPEGFEAQGAMGTRAGV